MTDTIKLTLSQQNNAWKASFLKQSTSDIIPITDTHHIAFHHTNMTAQNISHVQFMHGYHTIDIDHVIGILGIEDSRYADEGIQKFSISTSLSAEETLHHIEAKILFESLLNSIILAGWERTIAQTQPRLSGYDAFLYAQMHDINYSIDASYVLPLDEWMLLENQSKWMFYAKGLYLTLTLMRENKGDRQDAGYFVTLDIMNRASFQRKYQKNAAENMSAELLADELCLTHQLRHQKEQEILKYGEFALDTQFVYPDEQV